MGQENQLSNQDWMRELEHDAQQFQGLVSRIDELAYKAGDDLHRRDYIGTAARIIEMREGLRLLCEITGVKLHVTN